MTMLREKSQAPIIDRFTVWGEFFRHHEEGKQLSDQALMDVICDRLGVKTMEHVRKVERLLEPLLDTSEQRMRYIKNALNQGKCYRAAVIGLELHQRPGFKMHGRSIDDESGEIKSISRSLPGPEKLDSMDMLCLCTGLERLYLASSLMGEVSTHVGALKHLKKFNISYNELSELPDEMEQLDSLIELDISHNRFTEVPSVIRRIPNLKILIIAGNPITELPEWFLSKTELGRIIIDEDFFEDAFESSVFATEFYIDSATDMVRRDPFTDKVLERIARLGKEH